MNICVYGASSEEINKSYIEQTEKFGEEIAKKGYGLVFGAGKYGLMGAVCRGAARQGGTSIGVVPEFFKETQVLTDQCTEIVFTQTMRQRKQYMEEHADAFVMLPGGIGTFDEFFEMITLKQLSRHEKPIIIYNMNGYFNPLLKMMEYAVEQKFLSENCYLLYEVCRTPQEIFEYIETYKPYSYDKYDVRKE